MWVLLCIKRSDSQHLAAASSGVSGFPSILASTVFIQLHTYALCLVPQGLGFNGEHLSIVRPRVSSLPLPKRKRGLVNFQCMPVIPGAMPVIPGAGDRGYLYGACLSSSAGKRNC